MRIAPFPFTNSAASPSRRGTLLGDTFPTSGVDESDEALNQRKREREHDAAVVAALAPNDSTSIINRDERDMTRTSRAFRRQSARQEGETRFREQRHSFKQTLSKASGEGTRKAADGPAASKDAGKAHSEAQEKRAAPASKTQRPDQSPSSRAKAPVKAAGRTAKAGGAVEHAGAQARTPANSTAASSAVPLHAGARAPTPAPTTPVLQAASVRVVGKIAPAGRVSGGGKPGAAAPASAAGTRASFKATALAGAKARHAESAQTADRQANIDRVLRVVRSSLNAKRSHAVMRIDPPELGQLRLQMDLRGESLTLRIDTSSDLAHRLLSRDLEKLRDGLDASGVRLERVEIRPPTPTAIIEEQPAAHDANTSGDADRGSSETDAEHSREQGTDSHPTQPTEAAARTDHPEPAAESLVNVIA